MSAHGMRALRGGYREEAGLAVFTVWCPADGDGEDDGRLIRASSAEFAAAEWARRDDYESAEYSIVKGDEKTVSVRDESGSLSSFVVRGEASPTYFATKIGAEDER